MDPGFHAVESGFQVMDSRLLSGTWISDSNRWGNSGFLELYSGFKNPGFWILQGKNIPDPQAQISRILESGFPFMG